MCARLIESKPFSGNRLTKDALTRDAARSYTAVGNMGPVRIPFKGSFGITGNCSTIASCTKIATRSILDIHLEEHS